MKTLVSILLILFSSCKVKEIEKVKQVEKLISKCEYVSREIDISSFNEFEIEVLDCTTNSNLDSVSFGYTILDAEFDIGKIVQSTNYEFNRKGINYVLPKSSLFKNIPINRKYDLYLTKDKYYYRRIDLDTLISKYKIYLMKYNDVMYIDASGALHAPEPD